MPETNLSRILMKKFRGKRRSGEEKEKSKDNINIKFDFRRKSYDDEI
jgi:hypothetical protein